MTLRGPHRVPPAAGYGLAGLALSGAVAAGVAARRWAVALRGAPAAAALLADLPGEPGSVRADDGLPLSVVRTGSGPLTVVFVHGYCLDRRCWHYQWSDLAGWRGGGARLVAYDQRSHGRSGRSRPAQANLDQLGRDLHRVLEVEAPTGPIVLVGHSMGGMTVMALAAAHPELFGSRIVGVGLLSTSAGRLGELTFGLPAAVGLAVNALAPRAVPLLGRRAALVDAGRRASGPAGLWLTQRFSFASPVPAERLALAAELIESTPFSVIADFYPAFASHDKLSALPVLRATESLVLVGEADRQTPPDHSRAIAAAVPGAELVLVPHAAHLVMLEHPALVSAHLAGLLDRACPR